MERHWPICRPQDFSYVPRQVGVSEGYGLPHPVLVV